MHQDQVVQDRLTTGQDHVLGEPPATALELLGYGWSLLELHCVNGSLRDTAPATTGVQPSCTAELDSDSVSLALWACTDGDTAPCYVMTEDPVSCSWPADQHLRLDFRNIGAYRPGHVIVECESGE